MGAISSNVGAFAWSSTSAWVGGVVPVSGDTPTIVSGSTVTYDVDQSGFASGLAGLVITGTLTASTSAGTYVLKMAGNITGAGTFNIGSSGTPYPTNCQFNILFTGAQQINCTSGLNLQFYCSNPTIRKVQLISSTSKAITGITKANPCVITCASHGLSNGTIIYLANVGGMTQISNQRFKVAGVTTNTFQINWEQTNIGVDTSLSIFSAWTSGGLVCPAQANAIGNTTLTIDQDVSSDPIWTSTLGSKIVGIVDCGNTNGYVEAVISSITSSAIVISSGLAATKVSGSRLALIARNIRVTGVTATIVVIPNNNSTVVNAEFSGNGTNTADTFNGGNKNISFDGTTSLCVRPFRSLGGTLAGVIGGASSSTFQINGGSTITSLILGGATGGTGGSNTGPLIAAMEVYGSTFGINAYEVDNSYGYWISGWNAAIGSVANGTYIMNGGALVLNGRSATYSGWFVGTVQWLRAINSGVSYLTGVFLGHIMNSGLDVFSEYDIQGAVFSGNTPGDIAIVAAGVFPEVVAHGAYFGSPGLFNGYQISVLNDKTPWLLANFDPVISGTAMPGRIQGWTPGGTITNNETPPASPPVALSFTHLFTFQANASNVYPVFVDIPVMGISGVTLTINVYLKKDTNSMGETPLVQLIDPNYGWDTASSKIADTAMTDNTSWQTITVSVTPSSNKQYVLRVRGRHTSGILDWNYAIATSGSSRNVGIHTGGIL